MIKLNVVMIGAFPEDINVIKGGVQASVYGLSQALIQRHDEIQRVKVFALPQTAEAKHPVRNSGGLDVTYLQIPFKILASNILHVPRLMREISKLENAVTHIHGTGLLQTALIISLSLRRLACVWTLHGITEKETWNRYCQNKSVITGLRFVFYRFMERLSLRFARQIIVDTPYVQQALPIKRDNIHVIPQGIFLDELAGTVNHPSTENPLILSVGVMDTRKGLSWPPKTGQVAKRESRP